MSAIKRIGEWAFINLKGSKQRLRFPSWMSDDDIVNETLKASKNKAQFDWGEYGLKPDTTWYHGTNKDFDKYSTAYDGFGSGLPTGGHWFSDAYGSAADFGDIIKEQNLNISNPLIVDDPSVWTRDNIPKLIRQAKDEGKDGLVALNVRDGAYTSNLAMVFDADKIVPLNKESSNLLASLAPVGVAGTLGYNAVSSDEAEAGVVGKGTKNIIDLFSQKSVNDVSEVDKVKFLIRRRNAEVLEKESSESGESLLETYMSNYEPPESIYRQSEAYDMTLSEMEDMYRKELRDSLGGKDESKLIEYLSAFDGELDDFLTKASGLGSEVSFQAKKAKRNIFKDGKMAVAPGAVTAAMLMNEEQTTAQDLMLGDPLTKPKVQPALRSDDKSFTELGDDFIADKLMQMGITTPERAQDSAEFINMLLGATGSYGGAQLGSDVGEGARWLQNYLSKDGHKIDWSEYE